MLKKDFVYRKISLIHEYDEETDYSKIYNSVSDCLKDYHKYCEFILNFVKQKTV